MLVIARKQNESIVINNDIIITVLKSPTYHVKIGIQASNHFSIKREEILEL